MTTRELADARARLAELRSQDGAWKGIMATAEERVRRAAHQESILRQEAQQIQRSLSGAFQTSLMGGTALGGQSILGSQQGVAREMRARLAAINRRLSERP